MKDLKTVDVFIGLDEPHKIAYDVCENSIVSKAKRYMINIHAINCNTVKEYKRDADKFESTQFAFARFFAPYLCDFTGVSMFVDGDFLFLNSIDDLLDKYDDQYAVMCCKHDYVPKLETKMDNKPQSYYPRKNWSSLMLFNNEHPDVKKLTPNRINRESGKYLHRFEWTDDENIGSIPVSWNWLVGYYEETTHFFPKPLHYTDGGPWLDEHKHCEHNEVWHAAASKCI